jgi:hypothetical protein
MMEGIFRSGRKIFKTRKGGVMENENTKVSVTLGYTLNLGNFQSLRIDLGVVDSKRNNEDDDQAFDRVYKFVEDKLTEKIKEAQLEADSDN